MSKVYCPYCNTPADLVKGDIIYPHLSHLHDKNFWSCSRCDAYVGTHKDTIIPLGTLANRELRKLRSQAHRAFDPIWKKGHLTRTEAYSLLAKTLKIKKKKCHIGRFNTKKCLKTIKFAIDYED